MEGGNRRSICARASRPRCPSPRSTRIACMRCGHSRRATASRLSSICSWVRRAMCLPRRITRTSPRRLRAARRRASDRGVRLAAVCASGPRLVMGVRLGVGRGRCPARSRNGRGRRAVGCSGRLGCAGRESSAVRRDPVERAGTSAIVSAFRSTCLGGNLHSIRPVICGRSDRAGAMPVPSRSPAA